MILTNSRCEIIQNVHPERTPDGRLKIVRRFKVAREYLQSNNLYELDVFVPEGTQDGAQLAAQPTARPELVFTQCVLTEQLVREGITRQKDEPEPGSEKAVLEQTFEECAAVLTAYAPPSPGIAEDGQAYIEQEYLIRTVSTYTPGVVGTTVLNSAVLQSEKEEVGLAITKVRRRFVASGIVQVEREQQAEGYLDVTFTSANTRVVPTALNPVAAYAGGTTYALGAWVVSVGILYTSKVAGNIGNTPATSPTDWAVLPSYSALGTLFPLNYAPLFQGGTATVLLRDRVRNINGCQIYEVTARMLASGGAISTSAPTVIRSWADNLNFRFPGSAMVDTGSPPENMWVVKPPAEVNAAVTVSETLNPPGVTPAAPTFNGLWSGNLFQWAYGNYTYIPAATGVAVRKNVSFEEHLGGSSIAGTNVYLGADSGAGITGELCTSILGYTASNPTYAVFLAAYIAGGTFIFECEQKPEFIDANGQQYYRQRKTVLT